MYGYGGKFHIFLFLSLSLYAHECWAHVNILINIQVPLKAGISYVNISFSLRTLFCEFRKWHLLQNLYYIQLPCQDSAKILGHIYNTTQCHNPDVQRMNSKYVSTKRNSVRWEIIMGCTYNGCIWCLTWWIKYIFQWCGNNAIINGSSYFRLRQRWLFYYTHKEASSWSQC